MQACDLCGKEIEEVLIAEVEGTELNVCAGCGKYGEILKEIEEKKPVLLPKTKIIVGEEIEESIVSDFALIIRRARERKGLKQEDFARFLNEKESLLEKWEKGSLTPSLGAAKKLGRILGINFIEKIEDKKIDLGKQVSGEITLADVIKIRKR
jgi:putative transcription factor